MLKPLTLSLSLAVALGASSLSLAGHHGPSAQCETPSPQGIYPSAQGCGDVCGPKHRGLGLCNFFKHRQKCYTYEWVLKKKRCGGLFGHHGGGGCGNACDTCGDVIYPSGQASGQILGSGQGYAAGQTYGAGQAAPVGQTGGTGQVEPPAAPAVPATGDQAPPPPATPPTASNDGLLYLPPAGN